MNALRLRQWVLLSVAAVAAALLVASAGAQGVTYGVSVSKGCTSPTYVGQPEQCFFIFGNNNPATSSGDTVKLSSIVDSVSNAGGPTVSANLLSSLSLVADPAPPAAAAPTCTGTGLTGNGTVAAPWLGATSCTLPYGSSLTSLLFSHYTPTPADYAATTTHKLSDKASFDWADMCDKTPTPDTCDGASVNENQASASTTLRQYKPTITTALSAATIAAGDTVHDTSSITYDVTPPKVNGTVTYQLFTDNTCLTPATTPSLSAQVPYSGGNVPNSPDVTFPNAGNFFFQATFSGDAADGVAGPVTSACTSEPISVVDAKISIAPNGVNPVGSPHVFTAHVQVNPGTGFVDASGAQVTFNIAPGGVGTLTSQSCTTDATGTCTVTDSSSTAGVDVVSASTTVSVGGITLPRSTDSSHGSSGPATKQWVNARINIAPSATNEINQPHTFTVTVQKDTGVAAITTLAAAAAAGATNLKVASVSGLASGQSLTVDTGAAAETRTITGVGTAGAAGTGVTLGTPLGQAHASGAAVKASGFGAAAGEHVDVTLTDSNNAQHTTPAGTCTNTGANTDANGQCTITFTSPKAGKVTAHATATVMVAGVPFQLGTNGVAPSSADAVKTFVDANIQITPATAGNRVGTTHVLTGHVNVNAGDGNGYVNAPSGTVINFSLSGPGSFVGGINTCTTAGATGSCTVTITSGVTGTSVIRAATSLTVGTVLLRRATGDANAGDSADAQKTWVKASISISPDRVNEIGVPHTFTVQLLKDNGAGLVPAAGEHVDVTLTDSNGAHHGATSGSCTEAGANTDANGQCTITFSSLTAGKVTGHATSTLAVNGATVTVDSNDAVKTYVDANVQITPATAANQVGTNHVLTGHVTINAGDGNGYVNAPAGTQINFAITNGPGSFTDNNTSTCTTVGTTGSCTVAITSGTTGVTTVNASTAITVGGVNGVLLTRATGDAHVGDSAAAKKTWVNARIAIAPGATNEVGQPHTFTVTLQKDPGNGNGFVAAAGEQVNVTLTDSNGANHTPQTGTCPQTDVNGQCTVVFTSPSAGKVTGHASATLNVGGVSIAIQTDGVAPNSGDAVKTFVDANIQITPATAANPLSTTHTLTGHVNVNAGTGAFTNAPDGTVINFSLSGPGNFVGGINTCTTAGGTGSCTVAITSGVAGTTTIHASTSVALGGPLAILVARSTGDGKAGDSPDAKKTWVSAAITIRSDATNEVGQPHTFTVTLTRNTGSGLAPAAGEHVTVTLTDSNGAKHTPPTGTCLAGVTDANGQCTISFTSLTAGKVTAHASSTLDVGGVTGLTVQTNGVAPSSGDAVKTFVDANIQISPAQAFNAVGTSHTLTAHVNVNTGDGTGFANAPAGTQINFKLTGGPGTFTSNNTSTCTTVGTTGSCTVAITSGTTGVTTVQASAVLTVGGVMLIRTTGDGLAGDSANAQKTWESAKITIAPDSTQEVGTPTTFTVTLFKDTGSGFVPAGGEHVTVTLTDSNGASHTVPTGTCTQTGANTDSSGQCTITFTSPTPGKVTGHATATVTLNGVPITVSTDGVAPNSADAVKTFVDANIQIAPPAATNPVGTTHTLTAHVNLNAGDGGGYVSAPDGTVINFSLSGAGSFVGGINTCTVASGTGSCSVQITSPVGGVSVVKAATAVTVGGVVLTRASGDGKAGDSPNAQKTWVDANIQITPATAANQLGTNHTLTGHVNVNPGSGFVNAPDGTEIDFSIQSGPGSFVGATSCTTTGGTGSCTAVITSSVVGTTAVRASTQVTVGGFALSRASGDGKAGDSADAQKNWVTAAITITPSATNEIGQPHTFTVQLLKNTGSGFVPASNEHVAVTLTDANGAAHTAPTGSCTQSGGNTDLNGKCTITFTSPTPGTVTGHASATITVNGVSATVQTDGIAPDSGDAVKTFVDANIQITPATAANQVGTNHTLTGHVNVNTGSGSYANAPAGTTITFSIVSGPGTFTNNNTSSCQTVGASGSCTVAITSGSTGVTVVNASTDVTVGGVALHRVTADGKAGDSVNAQKTWVNARITIAPSATNEINQPHTFTVTLQKDLGDGKGFVAAGGEHVSVTLNDSNGAAHTPATGTCTQSGANTDSSGQCTITLTSPSAGKVTAHASSTLTVNTVSITVGSSVDAVKTFVDANVQITPAQAFNAIGTTHTLTGHVNVNAGDGSGYVNAPAGNVINFQLLPGGPAGASFVAGSTCTTVGTTGSCTVAITSPSAGTSRVRAFTAVNVGGVVLVRASGDGNAGDSADATKAWETAKITIAPDTTQEVGTPTTFTVTLSKNVGGVLVPAAGEHVDVTLTDSSGAVHTAPTGTCTQSGANTDASGQCTITFTSPTPGKVTGHATSTLDLNGVPVTVSTNGVAPNSGDAVKTFVDANVQISPATAFNQIGSTHTLTGHVNVNAGDGAYANGPDGTVINFALSGSGSFVGGINTCTTASGTGSCTVQITSQTAGVSTVRASTSVNVSGVVLSRVTNDGKLGDSIDATKTWEAAKITIAPDSVQEVGTLTTFTVTVTKDVGGGPVPAAGEHVDVVLTDSNGATHTAPTGTCTQSGANTDVNGQCTVTFTSPTAGKVTGHATALLTLNGVVLALATNGVAPNSGDAVKTFVDTNIQISPQAAFNQVGSTHTLTGHVNVNTGNGAGFTAAPDGTKLTFSLAGPGSFVGGVDTCATAGGTGSCTVVITSGSTGSTIIKAATDVTVLGVPLHRETADGKPGDSPSALKTWEALKISIVPDSTQEVGTQTSFVVTLLEDTGSGFVPATGEHVTVTLTDSNGATHTAPTGSCTQSGANTDLFGQCTITFTSPTPGKVTGHATATVTLNGVPITVSTNGVAPNSGDAVKTFVDANIQISPLAAFNPLNTNHTLTGHVNVNDGTAAPYANAPAGTTITFTKVSGVGSFVNGNTCQTAGTTGSCTVQITSSTSGTTVVKAATDVTVAGVPLHRETGDGKAGDSANASKAWERAVISISPSATNAVGQAHTFTVTLQKDTGTGQLVAANGEHVDVTFTDANGAAHTAPAGSCTTTGANTDANGRCLVTINSASAGKVTAHAAATLNLNGVSVHVETDGQNGDSGDAVKTYVDANVQISPSPAFNSVGTTHTLTGHVNVNTGTGRFVNAPDGTVVNFAIQGGTPGSFVGGINTCTTAGGTGSCTVVISSAVTGTTVVRASTAVTVGGVSLSRSSGDGKAGDSADAQKTWVNAKISIAASATNAVGQPHTFTVTLQKDTGDGEGFVAAGGEHVAVTLADSNGAGHTAPTGSCTASGANTDGNGQCTITFTSLTPGQVTAHATSTLTVNHVQLTVATNGVSPNSSNAVKTFVDANIQITPAQAFNAAGTTHTLTGHVNVNAGNGAFASAPAGTVINFSLRSATGSFVGGINTCTTIGTTGSCTVQITSPTTGTSVVRASTAVTVGNVMITRSTGDANVGDSADATKAWESGTISIAPSAINEVGQPHTFTVTLLKNAGDGAGFVAAAGEHVDVTLTDAGGASHTTPTGSCTGSGANTDSNGQCTIAFTSPAAGTVTGHATATIDLNGVTIPLATDGVSPNSGDAVKTFVDADIQITPASAANPTGTTHTLTGHVNVNTGTGGPVNAPDGTVIDFSLSGAGSFVGGIDTCTTAGGTGSCNVAITSAAGGTSVVRASTSVSVGGRVLSRSSGDGKAGDSADAKKAWVAAKISIAPSATNVVGQPHTFTVTLVKDTGTGAFVPAQGEHVEVTLADAKGAAHTTPTGSCTTAGANTDASGQCTIVFNSATAGTVTGHATAKLTVNTVPLTVQTDGSGGSSGDAIKTYVDANIQIAPPTASNPVSTMHVLTGHVNVNDGSGAFANAADGTTITFSIVSGPGSFAGNANTCQTAGGTGSCTVTITSTLTGTTVVSAATDITVGGQPIHRETADGKAGDSANASKTWRDVTVTTTVLDTGNNDVTNTTLLAGAVVHDKVVVNGLPAGGPTPAGSVTFTLYQSDSCDPASPVVSTETKTLDANGTATTSATAPLGAGSYGYQATFAGDAPNAFPSGTGACEPFAVNLPPVLPCVLGYPDGSNTPRSSTAFNESSVLVSAGLFGTGAGQHVGVFYSDEHALTLGAEPGVTPYPGTPPNGGQPNPSVGNKAATDGAGRPIFPAMFVTDITFDGSNRSGDWQQGADNTGAKTPTRLFGTWKDATVSGTSITPGADPASNPNWQLGTGADTPPSPTSPQQYTSEVVWDVASLGLQPGHAYRLQVMVHDGDQNHAGGDVGEACVNVVVPAGPSPDASIGITPATATNPVGTTHTLTAHVNVKPQFTFGNAPDGTAVKFSIVSGPGSFVGGVNTCTTSGGTGSCTVAITSSTPGTTAVRASTDVVVSGVSVHRETGDQIGQDSADAAKTWRGASVVTHVLDANGADVTGNGVATGATVHDTVTVSAVPSGPAPTGKVTFTLLESTTCDQASGSVSSEQKTLDGNGTATSSTASGLADGSYGYLVSYAGDANYPAATGVCEPFTVGPTTTPCPGGSFSVRIDPSTGDATIVYDQFPAPNDNSYGANAVGWGTKGHKFSDLTGSDHAGFDVLNAGGTDVLDFNIDYLSTKSGTPSGYASLGPFGGDGKVNVGTLTSSDIAWDTSLAQDLNALGYFSGGTQVVGTNVANLLVDSPPTLDRVSNYTLTPAAAAAFANGWNFHDTYFVTIKASKLQALGAIRQVNGSWQLNSGWSIQPNADELHNSPAKPCP